MSERNPRRAPLSTYRLQLNLNFTFQDAAEIVPYLNELGITDLYASPSLQARPGSLHGYDISDHNRLNPELGGEEGHAELIAALREHRMGQVLDIVPNHMGIGEPTSSWWMDVLENGPSSPFAAYFDIDWNPLKQELAGKVLLPILADQFGHILESGALRLVFEDGRFRIRYHEHLLPVSPKSSSLVLRAILAEMGADATADDPDLIELASIVTALEHLPPRSRADAPSVAERRRESFVSRRRLTALEQSSGSFRTALSHALEAYNGSAGDPRSFDDLERLLDDQAYRLAYWRVAAEEINYRRFFDINDLAGLRVERQDVFDATHRRILELIADGKVTALRVDHPDGLFDPSAYLRHLQDEATRHAGDEPVYILIEKILTGNEPLAERWPIAGTVGYEFMFRVNGLFVASGHEAAMSRVYREFVGERIDYANLVYEKKKLILRVALASELNVLAYLLNRISEKNRRSRDFTLGSLTDALRETIACFPVYRTYIDAFSSRIDPLDMHHVERSILTAVRRNRATSPSIFDFIRNILLLQWPDDLDDAAREEHALFVMKFQQLTGPVMAKGAEDTSFYIYNRLVSLNEVGGEPNVFGITPHELHGWLGERRHRWPLTMNSSTTHDTKRSEDVRARIHVLSEMPEEWEAAVQRWAEMNSRLKREVDGDPVPDRNDEYLLYQTLVGAWPLSLPDAATAEAFRERIQNYMEKATREAKVHTSWINPNEAFDDGLRAFIGELLEDPRPDGAGSGSEFITDLLSFHRPVAACGMLNSLAQTLVKLTAPGMPDIYQGQEIWDFSLVDPDNRRPVEYTARSSMLSELKHRRRDEGARTLALELFDSWHDGRIKMYVTMLALHLRRQIPELFREGEYVPLEVGGDFANHVFAYARTHRGGSLVVVVPRLPLTFARATGASVADGEAWGDTHLVLSGTLAEKRHENLFLGGIVPGETRDRLGSTVRVARVLEGFPVALLASPRPAI